MAPPLTVYNSRTKSSKDHWETPPYFFNIINEKYQFTVDIASSDENCLVEKHYTEETNGLIQDLQGEVVFCNPPYNDKERWLKKCYEEGQKENTIIVVLIPNVMDTKLFHKYCMKAYKIYAVKGRVQFLINGERPFKIRNGKKVYNGNNLGSLLVVFKKHDLKNPKLRGFEHR